jgi:hypothetical protein
VNAETLVKIVHDKMDSFGLERRKLGSLCTDGLSVMIAKNGVAGKLKNENPQLINIHCICHKLALACVQSNDDVQVIKQNICILPSCGNTLNILQSVLLYT